MFRLTSKRWSSVSAILKELERNAVPSTSISQVIGAQLSDLDLTSLHEIIKLPHVSPDTVNEVLQHGLPHDFSLYFTVGKCRSQHVWTNESLVSLISSNPGRLFDSYELYQKLAKSPDTPVQTAVVEKLLNGEKCDQGEYVLGTDNMVRALELVKKMPVVSDEIRHLVVEKLADANALTVPVLKYLEDPGLVQWASGQLASCKDETFSVLFDFVFTSDPKLVSKEAMCAKLETGRSRGKNFELESKLNLSPEEPISTKYLLMYIDENKLDTDKTNESLLLRIQLMDTYGMELDDVETALKKFHHYQTHEKFGIEWVQIKLVQAFTYQAFKQNEEVSLKIASTLLPENVPIKLIQGLILAHSKFDVSKSLDIYNDYIQNVSKKVNPQTQRSPSGLLTESLAMANLFDQDREFAQLLLDKAVDNGIISNEYEIAEIKKVFKVYGDAFKDDSWDTAKEILDQHILLILRRL